MKQALTFSSCHETGRAGGKLKHLARPSLFGEEWRTKRRMDAGSGRCQALRGKAELPVARWRSETNTVKEKKRRRKEESCGVNVAPACSNH